MNHLYAFLILISCSLFSCLDLASEYSDINYISPKIIPFNRSIVLLKNIHRYRETGTPGGINTDEISSDWYLITYSLDDNSSIEQKIDGINLSPFWIKKGITSATEKYVSIITNFEEYILDRNTLEKKKLPEILDIHDAYIEPNNQKLIIIEGFLNYYISSYDVESQSVDSLINLDAYYNNLAQSYEISPNRFIVWDVSKICILDIINKTAKSFNDTALDIKIYNFNKAAILGSDGTLQFYSFTADTFLYEYSITLQYNDPTNFSISNAEDFLVYQTNTFKGRGSIILLDIPNNHEKVLFEGEHKEQ